MKPNRWDIIVGLPAGFLIFMGTILGATIAGISKNDRNGGAFLILITVTLLVGFLAGITRLQHGPATGFFAGLTMAAIIIFLWLNAGSGDQYNPEIIGYSGVLLPPILCPVGGWFGAKLRMKP